MASSGKVVEGVKDKTEGLEPFHVETRFFNICMIGFYFDVWVEFACGIFCDLDAVKIYAREASWKGSYQSFWLLDMFKSE